MFTIACCLVAGLGLLLEIGLNLVAGWLVVMHTYLYYFRLSLSNYRCYCPRHAWYRGQYSAALIAIERVIGSTDELCATNNDNKRF